MDRPSKFQFGQGQQELVSGFLTEYWQSDEALPRISGLEVPIYFIMQGVKNSLSLPMSNAVAITTITVSFYLFSGFFLIIQNIDSLMSQAGGSLSATAYLKADSSEEAVNAFLQELEHDRNILRFKYVSREAALELLREDLGDQSSFLDGFESDNPLPASVDISLRPGELGISKIDDTIYRLNQQAVVDEVVYGSEWVERFQRILKVFRYLTWGVLSVVLAIMVFIIANTIKLVVYSRRDEISIMRLVGATPSFVKFPFFLGGLIQGLFGAGISMIFVYLSYVLIDAEISSSALLGMTIPQLAFLTFNQVTLLVVFGALVGGIGSLIAVRRFVDV